jgi:F-type H+-transporting ATPase subunit b
VHVRSTFDLPATRRDDIQQALNESLSSDIQIQFDTTPDLISGIELTANGWKVPWNIADTLGSLEERVGELIKEQSELQIHAGAAEKTP